MLLACKLSQHFTINVSPSAMGTLGCKPPVKGQTYVKQYRHLQQLTAKVRRMLFVDGTRTEWSSNKFHLVTRLPKRDKRAGFKLRNLSSSFYSYLYFYTVHMHPDFAFKTRAKKLAVQHNAEMQASSRQHL